MMESPATIVRSWRPFRVVFVIVCALLVVFFTAMIVYGASYKDRVPPGVFIGEVPIGGMERTALTQYIQKTHEHLFDEGIRFHFADALGKDTTFIIYPRIILKDDVVDIVHIDTDKEVTELIPSYTPAVAVERGWSLLWGHLFGLHRELKSVRLDRARFQEALHEKLDPFESPARNAGVRVVSLDPFMAEMTSSTVGYAFTTTTLEAQINAAWSRLERPEVWIRSKTELPAITESDVKTVMDRLPSMLSRDGISLTYTDPHTKKDFEWNITKAQLAGLLEVQKNSDRMIGIGISIASTTAFFDTEVVPLITVDAHDAKFKIGENHKVVEFEGSRPGIQLDKEKTYRMVNDALFNESISHEAATTSFPLVVVQVDPAVTTESVNDLGIKEILGIGYSNYKGSPANRIKNIRHAVRDKLNGILIKPGETFSLLNAVQPFTEEGGYLPELVIKGDRIKPEIGGGLCQIGTTMFRASMNAGMPIVERRNHSLVVRYYNDPRNNNPGTDATIYDPSPDFKFLNDTGHYILLTTKMNEETKDLHFTLWGTSDGRKGYYTEPIVSHWIPYGDDKKIESDEIPVGEEKCEIAHIGGSASFTYIRELPSGEKIEKIFESYYRPLPRVCLVGVPKKSEEGTDNPALVGNLEPPVEVAN